MNKESDISSLTAENERLLKTGSAKSDIVSVGTHQIRTSLSALKWIIKMFLDGDLGKLTTEQENLLRKAYESNERAIKKVSEILIINKSEDIAEKEPVFEKVDLLELIDSCIFDFSGEAHACGIEIIFLTPNEKPKPVRGDREKLRIVLENLIENAIKYNNQNGKVFISIKEIEKMIQVSIKDTGIGISTLGQSRIFEKFFRDENAEKKEAMGSGIGLFDTKKIIEEHGGKIYFESKQGNGTTFFFRLPIY